MAIFLFTLSFLFLRNKIANCHGFYTSKIFVNNIGKKFNKFKSGIPSGPVALFALSDLFPVGRF